MVRRSLFLFVISMSRKKNKPIIELRKVNKRYVTGDVVTHVLHDISLSIHEGEFVALMGPSGSGKSTLMHIIGFLDRLTKGKYLFAGKDVSRDSDDELAYLRRSEVGFVFQFFNLLAKSTVIDNVMLPMIYQRVPHGERKERAIDALKAVGLAHRVEYFSNQISGGERQRVAIARALVGEPRIILADEPTGNLDSKSGEEVLKLFRELHKQGHTIVMVTHESEAAAFAQRIIRLKDGAVVSDKKNARQRKRAFTK